MTDTEYTKFGIKKPNKYYCENCNIFIYTERVGKIQCKHCGSELIEVI